MTDREKVIKGLECCADSCRYGCPYNDIDQDCQGVLCMDALALLQAQEPKPVHVTADINYRKIGECPNCSNVINSGDYPNYCGRCGQAVKWE